MNRPRAVRALAALLAWVAACGSTARPAVVELRLAGGAFAAALLQGHGDVALREGEHQFLGLGGCQRVGCRSAPAHHGMGRRLRWRGLHGGCGLKALALPSKVCRRWRCRRRGGRVVQQHLDERHGAVEVVALRQQGQRGKASAWAG